MVKIRLVSEVLHWMITDVLRCPHMSSDDYIKKELKRLGDGELNNLMLDEIQKKDSGKFSVVTSRSNGILNLSHLISPCIYLKIYNG